MNVVDANRVFMLSPRAYIGGLRCYVSLRLCYRRTVVSLRMTFINSGVKFSTVTALKIPLENTSQDSPVAEIPSYVPHAGS